MGTRRTTGFRVMGRLLLVALAAALAQPAPTTSQQTLTIGQYELVAERVVSRRLRERTYTATLTNVGAAIKGATAVVNGGRKVTIVDGSLSFPVTPGGGVSQSVDTFTIVHAENGPFRLADLRWTVTPTANLPPVANAGPDQTAALGTTVTLTGGGSSDPDGDQLTYSWRLVSAPIGSNAVILDPSQAVATLTPDVSGVFSIELVVHDGTVLSPPDTVSVTVSAIQPGDADADGLTDDQEHALGTDPNDADTDDDGLSDGAEVNSTQTSPLKTDTDGDTVGDGEEINVFGIDPNRADTDGDGFNDDGELRAGSSPTNADSVPFPSSGPTSIQLIDDALATGALTPEQGLTFKVFAQFGDARLPPQYRGRPTPHAGTRLMAEVARQLPAMSAGTQELLRPFFLLPMYEGSWFPPPPAGAEGTTAKTTATEGRTFADKRLTASSSPCVLQPSPYFDVKVTAHANIHYPSQAYDEMYFDPVAHARGLQTAEIIARHIEQIWAVETAFFGRFPPSDASIDSGCNGGDGALDITIVTSSSWIGEYGSSAPEAITVAFTEGCEPRPSHILIRSLSSYFHPNIDDPVQTEEEIRDLLAHEFFHTIEFGYSHPAACSDYDWLGEATANWAIDLVFPGDSDPGDQAEHPFAAAYMYVEHVVPLDQAYQEDKDKTNGYADYVFLQYLARKYNSPVIKAVWETTERADSVGAIAATLAGVGGLEQIWHNFALTAWNDYEAHVQDDFFQWDKLKWGLKRAFANPRADSGDVKARDVTLDGKHLQTIDLISTAAIFGGGAEIERLSFHVDHLKFTDEAVSYVVIEGPDAPELQVQALVKIGGQWRSAENWSGITFKTFCRDKTDERIEELVLVYSNGNPARPADPITLERQPRLVASNVGCWQWHGSATMTTNTFTGSVITESGRDVLLERHAALVATPGGVAFVITSATVTIEHTGPINDVCTVQMGPATEVLAGTVATELGGLAIELGENQTTAKGSGVAYITATTIVTCEGQDPIINTSLMPTIWMMIPLQGLDGMPLSADGRQLKGTLTLKGADGVRTLVVDFAARRQ